MSTISQGKKRKKPDTRFWVRLVVWILIGGMLIGTFTYAIYFLLAKRQSESTPVIQAADVTSEDDYMVRVALEYGSSVAVSFKTAAEGGYAYGYNDADNNFIPLGETSSFFLHAACRENLSFDSTAEKYAAAGSTVDVGAYHVRVDPDSGVPFETLLSKAKTAFDGLNVFPAYIDGEQCVMIGAFATLQEAETLKESILETYALPPDTEPEETEPPETEPPETESAESETVGPDTEETAETPGDEPDGDSLFAAVMRLAEVSEPTSSAVMFVDSDTGLIEWEYDWPDSGIFPCLQALQNGEGLIYIYGYKSSGVRKYDGTLEFAQISGTYTSGGSTVPYHGMRVINVLPVETYICGVIPYEIGNSWPLETQKAFAVAVRSYVIANRKYHEKAYHADVCCTSCCQVYKGFGSTNDRVRQAGAETKGLILTYKNKICNCMYSSSTGGSTASAYDYGGSTSTPYLAGVATPWELYTTHSLGSWYTEYTPNQLYTRLKSLGYKNITSNVASITIDELAANSTYVRKVTVTDTKGNRQTITGTAAIKKAFAVNNTSNNQLRSANFVVGMAGSTVERINFTALGFNATVTEPTEGVGVISNPYLYNVTGRQKLYVVTPDGVQSFYDSNSEKVITASGIMPMTMSRSLDSQYYPTITGTGGQVIPDVTQMTVLTETEQITLPGASGCFTFYGRGWGHGVGMSQYGIYDMGKKGYDFATMLYAYYTGTKLMNFNDFLNGNG